jgi:predicted ArsR family transcriptional regulator
MKPKCRDRILSALKWAAKSPQQLATELFVTKATAQLHLTALEQDELVFRKFFHNARKNRPDYVYSSVRFPAYAKPVASRKSTLVQDVLGSWDAP